MEPLDRILEHLVGGRVVQIGGCCTHVWQNVIEA
jgi:hypothetical protein